MGIITKIIRIYRKNKEIINYLIVGVLTTIVSLGAYYACVFTFINPSDALQLQVANILSWVAAVTFAYFTNRKFVFESKNEAIIKEALSFYASRILTLFLDMVFMFVLVTLLNVNDKFAKLFVQALIMISNYILSKFIVFRG